MKKLANALNAFWEREGRDAYSLSPTYVSITSHSHLIYIFLAFNHSLQFFSASSALNYSLIIRHFNLPCLPVGKSAVNNLLYCKTTPFFYNIPEMKQLRSLLPHSEYLHKDRPTRLNE